jgi:hypothetical protein
MFIKAFKHPRNQNDILKLMTMRSLMACVPAKAVHAIFVARTATTTLLAMFTCGSDIHLFNGLHNSGRVVNNELKWILKDAVVL